MKIILAVTGGIAAYKTADLARRLIDMNFTVQVVMTANAEKFVTPLTFEALTGNPVIRAVLPQSADDPMPHITCAKSSDLMVVAPATANIIGKFASGIADDTLSTMFLATDKPVIMAPAMNCVMYAKAVVQENIQKLGGRGVIFVGPDKGKLACGDYGEGKLAPIEDIAAVITDTLKLRRDLEGLNILVTAGGTREPVDSVRFIGNLSSGKMGLAIARSASLRGARVTLVAGAIDLPPPDGVDVVNVQTAEQMLESVGSRFDDCDALVMSAAVGDYRVKNAVSGKVKKNDKWSIDLVANPDIILEMGRRKTGQVIAGFAAETDQPYENGRRKLIEKNMDMIVINDVARKDIGFGSDYNEVTILTRAGQTTRPPKALKSRIAELILDKIVEIREERLNAEKQAG